MAISSSSFPPDVPKTADEARETVGASVSNLRGKAAEFADKASETVKDHYERAKEAWDEAEPLEAVRGGGQAVVQSVERHPLAALGLGVAGIGLVAWALLRNQTTSGWERYQPDYGRWSGWLRDYGSEVADAGDRAVKSGSGWLRSHRDAADDYAGRAGDYAALARDYADRGGRMLAKRAEREPMAVVVGLGLAAYVIGSLLSSASAGMPASAPARKRAARR
ncbi:hypothetical protein [Bosea sp. ANAM02]|uniref:hypothetical protein n=1 Tax=Bosea sp. ANAM02 TaxID=2020412 RepID=UPI00140EE912|nr:hypothetical protein [Bosea sp. ANAM02]BCB18445.1 hypothetical protein OCUBac02_13390 [Bosea sp. ANAM02]